MEEHFRRLSSYPTCNEASSTRPLSSDGPNKLTDQTKQAASFNKVNVRKPWLIGMIAIEWDGERLLVRQCTQVTRQMQLLAESKPWDPEHIPEISSLVVSK